MSHDSHYPDLYTANSGPIGTPQDQKAYEQRCQQADYISRRLERIEREVRAELARIRYPDSPIALRRALKKRPGSTRQKRNRQSASHFLSVLTRLRLLRDALRKGDDVYVVAEYAMDVVRHRLWPDAEKGKRYRRYQSAGGRAHAEEFSRDHILFRAEARQILNHHPGMSYRAVAKIIEARLGLRSSETIRKVIVKKTG